MSEAEKKDKVGFLCVGRFFLCECVFQPKKKKSAAKDEGENLAVPDAERKSSLTPERKGSVKEAVSRKGSTAEGAEPKSRKASTADEKEPKSRKVSTVEEPKSRKASVKSDTAEKPKSRKSSAVKQGNFLGGVVL